MGLGESKRNKQDWLIAHIVCRHMVLHYWTICVYTLFNLRDVQ